MNLRNSFLETKRSLSLLSLAFLPMQGRVRTLYQALSENNSLCHEKLYLNLGYWGYGAETLDQAAEDMARLLAESVGLRAEESVLDVGCGFGDQDFFWAGQYGVRKILAVNITGAQIAVARKRAHELKQTRVEFIEGDATDLHGLPDSSVDVVFALESAFHFKTREKFLAAAFRILRPGGRLGIVDLTAVKRPLKLKDRIAERIGRSFWQIPKENLHSLAVLNEKLSGLGFDVLRSESIWHKVYPPFVKFARRRLKNQEVAARMNLAFRKMLQASLSAREKLDPEAMDYVLVVAKKPNHAGIT